jgi:hypothetical protein
VNERSGEVGRREENYDSEEGETDSPHDLSLSGDSPRFRHGSFAGIGLHGRADGPPEITWSAAGNEVEGTGRISPGRLAPRVNAK